MGGKLVAKKSRIFKLSTVPYKKKFAEVLRKQEQLFCETNLEFNALEQERILFEANISLPWVPLASHDLACRAIFPLFELFGLSDGIFSSEVNPLSFDLPYSFSITANLMRSLHTPSITSKSYALMRNLFLWTG